MFIVLQQFFEVLKMQRVQISRNKYHFSDKQITLYCLTSVEQHQAATEILVVLEGCCSSDVIYNDKYHCMGEIFLPFERGSRSLEVPL